MTDESMTQHRVEDGADAGLSLSVVIVTWRRPMFLQRCLESLHEQHRPPDQIVVVDASEDDQTRMVAAAFRDVEYVHFPGGAGHMTTARNQGLLDATGDVIAFLDDDTRAHPKWAHILLARYASDDVAAVAGRTLNNVPGEDIEGVAEIGRLLQNGHLTANFAAKSAEAVEIEHGIGANMSFRRTCLADLGGFRDFYPGTAMREDTDVFLRVRALGGRVIFDPDAVVEHLPAPHIKGRRFGYRYAYYAARNHVQLLAFNFGMFSSITRAYLHNFVTTLATADRERSAPGRALRACIKLFGTVAGLQCAIRYRAFRPIEVCRRDPTGENIRRALRASIAESAGAGGSPSRH